MPTYWAVRYDLSGSRTDPMKTKKSMENMHQSEDWNSEGCLATIELDRSQISLVLAVHILSRAQNGLNRYKCE